MCNFNGVKKRLFESDCRVCRWGPFWHLRYHLRTFRAFGINLLCLALFFYPLQVLFIFTFFIRPQYSSIRKRNSGQERWFAIHEAIWFPPFLSRRDGDAKHPRRQPPALGARSNDHVLVTTPNKDTRNVLAESTAEPQSLKHHESTTSNVIYTAGSTSSSSVYEHTWAEFIMWSGFIYCLIRPWILNSKWNSKLKQNLPLRTSQLLLLEKTNDDNEELRTVLEEMSSKQRARFALQSILGSLSVEEFYDKYHWEKKLTVITYQQWAWWVDFLETFLPGALENVASNERSTSLREGLPRASLDYMGSIYEESDGFLRLEKRWQEAFTGGI